MLTADHIIPLSRGGTNKRTNLVAACYECNQAKQALPPEEFAEIMEIALAEKANYRNPNAKHK